MKNANTGACNPKLMDSGIIDCKPQQGFCPQECPECFFNRLKDKTAASWLPDPEAPLIPDPDEVNAKGLLVRFNSIHDSNINGELVFRTSLDYDHLFYNTSLPQVVGGRPIVITVNPRDFAPPHYTPAQFLEPADRDEIMFVRVRVPDDAQSHVPLWNLAKAWASVRIPVVLTFVAYYTHQPNAFYGEYERRTRHINDYWCCTPDRKNRIVSQFIHALGEQNSCFIHTCGTTNSDYCKNCGNCKHFYNIAAKRLHIKEVE